METFNLNTIPGAANPVCHVSQFDEGRSIRVNLYEGGSIYTLDGSETISVSVRKPDGHLVVEGITNTEDSYVEIITTEQMTACAGENLCEIKIEKGSDTIGSLNFIMQVEPDPLDGGDPSESFVYNLQVQIAEAVAQQYDADNVVFDNAPTAGHGVGFAVTSEGILAAIPDELNDLSDVTTSAPTSGEALVWDGSKWTNGTVSTVGSIDDLNDVDTTGKAEGDSLRYNATAQEWEAKPTTVEMTLAEYTALGGDYSGYENTTIIITDAPNLNATAQDISYDGGADTVWDKVESKANITALPSVKYEEINVALDSSGEGTLYTSNKLVVGIKDIPSDSLYVGYAVYFAGTQTKVKAISRSALAFTSQGVVSMTRKIGVWYLDNISIT